jgi:hypothetical protein
VRPGERVSLHLEVKRGSRPLAATEKVAVVQFDTIAPGWAQIGVESIGVSDMVRKALPVAVPDRQMPGCRELNQQRMSPGSAGVAVTV